jgi:hypothetical protein
MMKRRHFIAGIAAFGLGGCGVSRSVGRITDSLDFWWNGMEGVTLTRAQIADIPYATIMAKIGRGPQSLLLLGRIDGPDLHWISADRNVFVTRGGRLMKTVGLPVNLVRTRINISDPITSGAATQGADERVVRYVDMMPGNYFDAGIRARYDVIGSERIEILDLHYDTLVVRERNSVPVIGWNHTNLFWIGREDGIVWRSEQHFAPDTPPLEITITKPAAI